MVQAAPLTLRQYGKFKDIIPLLDDWWWLATPLWTRWLRSPSTNYTNLAWLVNTNGNCSNYYCSSSYGVRPALKLKLYNLGKKDYEVKRGDKISQLCIEIVLTPTPRQVDKLNEGERGTGGFGSTGR